MKMKKVLAILLSAVMLITMSISAFGETYIVNEFADDYVICEEDFTDGEINSNLIQADGYYEFYDDDMLEFRADSSLTADLAGYGKSVSDGIVNVSFAFSPSIDTCESVDTVATQSFDFGGGFVLDAQWVEYGSYSTWLKGGMFSVDGTELVKFNADGTGGVDAGMFRAVGSESATAPSLYYAVDAKINLTTSKVSLTITETETLSGGASEPVVIYNGDHDYNADSFGYFTESFESTYGEDEYDPFYSCNYYLNISTEGTASYKNFENVEEVVTRTYPDGYTFVKDSDANITLECGGNYTHFVDLESKAVTSGIVNVSLKFSPNALGGTDRPERAVQTFEFGNGFNFNAEWSTADMSAQQLKNSKFRIGSTEVMMNPEGWIMNEAGRLRLIGMEQSGPVGSYDINAKINLDAKKVYLTINEHLVYQDQTKDTTLLNNAEFDYKSNVFDYYKNQLSAKETRLRSQQSSLLIVAEGECSYNSEDDVKDITYSENTVFVDEGDEWIFLEDETVGYYNYFSEKTADLSKTPINKGIVDVSYTFHPNMYWGPNDSKTAVQTFKFGDGFEFDARWTNYGGGAAWMLNCHFNVAGQTIMMNSDKWNIGDFPAGYLRLYNIHGGDWTASSPYGVYDIKAKINLDTKKIYLTIIENLHLTGESKEPKVILNNQEYNYNADSFDSFTTSIAGDEKLGIDAYHHSRNRSLKIQADGVTAYEVKDPDEDMIIYSQKAGNVILQGGQDKEFNVDLSKNTVIGGIVDVSYRFWPNTIASPDYKEARQKMDFGGGFALDAIWRSYGGNASWIYKSWLETNTPYPYTWKWMNQEAWGAEASNLGAGCFRTMGANATSPHAYYDIKAKINLDTKKIYLTVIEHLETATEERTALLWDNVEFDYLADEFAYYKASFDTYEVGGATKTDDTYLQSLNSNLLIQADGKVTFKEVEGEEVVISDTVEVKDGANAVTTLAGLKAAQNPYVNLTFAKEVGEVFSAVLVIAYYNGDELVMIDAIKNISAPAKFDGVEYNYNLKVADVEADSIKAFVWSDITGIMPLKNAAIMQ
ncbi:MAG: hypothetical protein E7415_03940 [Ruminococcaceae bacterium]|nr:hypothetical protein [Oscillospiraceae bacterium]